MTAQVPDHMALRTCFLRHDRAASPHSTFDRYDMQQMHTFLAARRKRKGGPECAGVRPRMVLTMPKLTVFRR